MNNKVVPIHPHCNYLQTSVSDENAEVIGCKYPSVNAWTTAYSPSVDTYGLVETLYGNIKLPEVAISHLCRKVVTLANAAVMEVHKTLLMELAVGSIKFMKYEATQRHAMTLLCDARWHALSHKTGQHSAKLTITFTFWSSDLISSPNAGPRSVSVSIEGIDGEGTQEYLLPLLSVPSASTWPKDLFNKPLSGYVDMVNLSDGSCLKGCLNLGEEGCTALTHECIKGAATRMLAQMFDEQDNLLPYVASLRLDISRYKFEYEFKLSVKVLDETGSLIVVTVGMHIDVVGAYELGEHPMALTNVYRAQAWETEDPHAVFNVKQQNDEKIVKHALKYGAGPAALNNLGEAAKTAGLSISAAAAAINNEVNEYMKKYPKDNPTHKEGDMAKQPNTQADLEIGCSIHDAIARARSKAKEQKEAQAKKLERSPSCTALGKFFKVKVKQHFKKNVTINAKAFGQLKSLIEKVGKKRIYRVLEMALDNWDEFLQYVEQERNWKPDCTVPNMGILLHLGDELKEFYLMRSGDKDVDEGETAFSTDEETAASNKNTIKNIWG